MQLCFYDCLSPRFAQKLLEDKKRNSEIHYGFVYQSRKHMLVLYKYECITLNYKVSVKIKHCPKNTLKAHSHSL